VSVKPTKVFPNGGVVVWQTAEEDGPPELPVLVHVDAGGMIVLSQEGRDVIVSPRTVKDLCESLKKITGGCSKNPRS
jgi:hypothetical protein